MTATSKIYRKSESDAIDAGQYQQQTVPVLQAKLDYAQSEWNKLKKNKKRKKGIFVSTCVDLKEATQEAR